MYNFYYSTGETMIITVLSSIIFVIIVIYPVPMQILQYPMHPLTSLFHANYIST